MDGHNRSDSKVAPGVGCNVTILGRRSYSGVGVSNSAQNSDGLVGRRREGRVLVISLRRAAKRNAIDRATADALDEALNELDDDDDL